MAALYTDQLEKLLAQVVVGKCMRFVGVFSADLVPPLNVFQSSSSCCCFAANTDPSYRPGKHWVLFISRRAADGFVLEYFDSYGMPLEMYSDLHLSCLRNGYLPLIKQYNTVMLQHLSTSVCGYYCVYFAHRRALGQPFASVVRLLASLGTSSLLRDKRVLRNVYCLVTCRSSSSYTANAAVRQGCCALD